jgi:hypothetical protein
LRRLGLLALLLAACRPGADGGTTSVAYPPDPEMPAESAFLADVDRSMGFRDCFQVVRDGQFVPADRAPRMRPEERVLGLDLGDVQIAYPINLLNHVEIVEHAHAGRDLLVCWCPLCGTGVVHDRRVDGRALTFGHSGFLWRNAFLLYDRETDSLWHHATGAAMSGPMRGKRLARFDAVAVMTYAAWRAEHPSTLVLVKPTETKLDVDADVYDLRNRQVAGGFGLALELPGAQRFYPFDALPTTGAVEDEVDGTSVVVVRDAAARVARAFDRRVDGVALSFDVAPGPESRPTLRERGGTRAWFLRSGAPVPGTGAAAALCPLPATEFEGNAWTLQHPRGVVRRIR